MKCPKCDAEDKSVIRIIYGEPDAKLIERAERGEVYLGGCILMKEKNYCTSCKHKF